MPGTNFHPKPTSDEVNIFKCSAEFRSTSRDLSICASAWLVTSAGTSSRATSHGPNWTDRANNPLWASWALGPSYAGDVLQQNSVAVAIGYCFVTWMLFALVVTVNPAVTLVNDPVIEPAVRAV